MRHALALALFLTSSLPALAEAVVYKGTVGDKPVVVELTEPGDGAVAGRYAYMSQGIDIPLQPAGTAQRPYVLSEEAPCTPGACVQDDDGTVADPPIAATWTLTPDADGATLSGTWTGGDATLPIALERIGRRALPEGTEPTPYDLHQSVFELTYGGPGDFTAEASPYDFYKVDVPMTEGPVQEIEGSTYRDLTDPRTQFAFPRVVALADGGDTGPINATLAREHARIGFYALDCAAMAYAGFGGNDDLIGMGGGTLGGFEDETVTVGYLSPTVMNFTASGSTFCGGAYPNNHADTTILDVRTGKSFALAHVLKDWLATADLESAGDEETIDQAKAAENPDAYLWAAGQPLVDYALAHRTVTDPDFDAECDMPSLIADNLGFRFAPGDRLVFALDGLPHALFACSEDVLTVPLADIPQLLAPEAADYFPALKANEPPARGKP